MREGGRTIQADDAIRLYLHLADGGDQLRSLSLVDSEEVCSRPARGSICAGKKTKRGRPGHEFDSCARCGQPWRSVVKPILEPRHRRRRGRTQVVHVRGKPPRGPKRSGLLAVERDALRLGWLHRVVWTVPKGWSRADWYFALAAFVLSLHGHGYTTIAGLGEKHLPGMATRKRWWSERKVREAVGEARERLEWRLLDARYRRVAA